MSTAIKVHKFLNNFFTSNLEESDLELYNSVKSEFIRQQNHIEFHHSRSSSLTIQGLSIVSTKNLGTSNHRNLEVLALCHLVTLRQSAFSARYLVKFPGDASTQPPAYLEHIQVGLMDQHRGNCHWQETLSHRKVHHCLNKSR